jgi:hypothetical protein
MLPPQPQATTKQKMLSSQPIDRWLVLGKAEPKLVEEVASRHTVNDVLL